MSKEYIIYADESVRKGKYYSNFYGGLLVRSKDLESVTAILDNVKKQENLFAEIKWQKVTNNYLNKYKAIINTFFDLVEEDRIKVRIMFTQNRNIPLDLETYHHEHEYFMLYYQFIKHAFGLKYSNPYRQAFKNLRIYLDRLPDTKEKASLFKSHLTSLSKSTNFRNAKIKVSDEQIAEVKSHNHILLQMVDVVLGSMQFRLNDKHKVKPKGAWRRGKRTIAKEKLYKLINKRIRGIYPNFNIGITTGTAGDRSNYWKHSYRHWLFVPNNYKQDDSKTKK
jgi:hypothetical protein